MKISVEVNNCAECMFSASNASLHNDPFTSSPITTYYVCQVGGGPDFIWHKNARKEIHPQCPKKN